MKTLTIETTHPNIYVELSRLFKNPESKCYQQDKLVYCVLDEENEEEYLAVVFNMSVFLMIHYVDNSGLCKTDKQRSFVLAHLLNNPDFRYAACMNLYSYLQTNTLIKESSYFLFNMQGLKDDIVHLLKILKRQEAFEEEKKRARKSLAAHGKKLKDYKTLYLVEDSQNGFALMSEKDEKINVDTLESEFGVLFKFDPDMDIEEYVAKFTAWTCYILNTKELNIEPSFLSIVNEMLSFLTLLRHEIDINVFDDECEDE